jgi:flavin-dependent dehydrogenase
MFDCKIIGGGPTGTYCGAKLAKLGYKVQIIEKVQHPRDKLCGGGLTLKSINLIKKLHTNFESENIMDFVENFYIVNPTTLEEINFDFHKKWLALVHRNEFDKWMLDKAIESGVDFKIDPKYDFYTDQNQHFIIAADGANSEIGKFIHGPFSSTRVVIATEGYVNNWTKIPFAAVVLNPTFDPENGGYSWLFGRHDTVGVGTGVVRSYDKHLNRYRNLITKIADEKYKNKISPKDYRNWIIPIYREGTKATYGKNIACIGDALGVADPIYAEGIAAGMISADVLVQSFMTYNDFSHFQEDLKNNIYFKQMKYMEFLQRQATGNYKAAFELLKKPGVVDGFIKFINWQQTPQLFVHWVWKHYPIEAGKLQWYVWKNKGREL